MISMFLVFVAIQWQRLFYCRSCSCCIFILLEFIYEQHIIWMPSLSLLSAVCGEKLVTTEVKNFRIVNILG